MHSIRHVCHIMSDCIAVADTQRKFGRKSGKWRVLDEFDGVIASSYIKYDLYIYTPPSVLPASAWIEN